MTLKILVADDSVTIQKIVGMAFENEDAEVEGIGDGQEAFDKIPDFKPDIVLADVDMPGLDGFQLSKKIKENPDLANIKVLLLASDFEDFDEDRFKKCQAENHISKPFKSDDIIQMVARVMEGETASEVAGEPSLQESSVEEEKSADDEPSLEELLESVEKLSTEPVEIAESPSEEPEDIPQPVEELQQEEEEFNEEPSTVIDDDILSGMIQDVKNEISEEPAPAATSDNDISGDMTQEVEEEISQDPVPEAVIDDEILSGMIQDVKNEIGEEPEPAAASGNDVLGEMIQDVETELEEKSPSPEPEIEEPVLEDQTFSDEVYAEVQTRKMENLDDLDSAFKEIVAGEKKQKQVPKPEAKESEMSVLGGIVPEPEDLLERMAPRAFSESERRPHTQEEINENLNAITGSSSFGSVHYQDSPVQEMEYGDKDDRFIQVTGEQVRNLLEKSLDSSLQKEMSGLSDIIVKTIREVVREIAPEIARSVIREEIEKIKKF
ncbi:MAG: response regulator [Nitrospinae bacterium]|nr:response regulator [Nitrospinota bacterium]